MQQAADLVRHAVDLGVTFIDTAKVYQTEPAVAAALKGRREGVVVSTKIPPLTPEGRADAAYISAQIDDSLRVLGLDTIDVMHLHGVLPQDYSRVIDECLAPLQRAQRDGKIRHIGVSEFWNQDLSHRTLQLALDEDHFDVILVGCNMLNSSALRSVLPKARAKGVATVLMFAVRRAFADARLLREICARLIASGEIAADELDLNDPFDFLIRDGDPANLIEAAYRYCRHLPGVSVVLSGTGSSEHLRQNIASIEAPALSADQLRRIERIFGRVHSVTGES